MPLPKEPSRHSRLTPTLKPTSMGEAFFYSGSLSARHEHPLGRQHRTNAGRRSRIPEWSPSRRIVHRCAPERGAFSTRPKHYTRGLDQAAAYNEQVKLRDLVTLGRWESTSEMTYGGTAPDPGLFKLLPLPLRRLTSVSSVYISESTLSPFYDLHQQLVLQLRHCERTATSMSDTSCVFFRGRKRVVFEFVDREDELYQGPSVLTNHGFSATHIADEQRCPTVAKYLRSSFALQDSAGECCQLRRKSEQRVVRGHPRHGVSFDSAFVVGDKIEELARLGGVLTGRPFGLCKVNSRCDKSREADAQSVEALHRDRLERTPRV